MLDLDTCSIVNFMLVVSKTQVLGCGGAFAILLEKIGFGGPVPLEFLKVPVVTLIESDKTP